MDSLLLCGYKLATRDLRLSWINRAYGGYDRTFYFEPGFDCLVDDGSELWKLQSAALDRNVYFSSVDQAMSLREGFRRYGKNLDILRVRLDLDHVLDRRGLDQLCSAEASPVYNCLFLGYDVGWLLGTHSIIFQPGFMDTCSEEVRCLWAGRLNEHGLFKMPSVAAEFRELYHRHTTKPLEEMDILEISLIQNQLESRKTCQDGSLDTANGG